MPKETTTTHTCDGPSLHVTRVEIACAQVVKVINNNFSSSLLRKGKRRGGERWTDVFHVAGFTFNGAQRMSEIPPPPYTPPQGAEQPQGKVGAEDAVAKEGGGKVTNALATATSFFRHCPGWRRRRQHRRIQTKHRRI